MHAISWHGCEWDCQLHVSAIAACLYRTFLKSDCWWHNGASICAVWPTQILAQRMYILCVSASVYRSPETVCAKGGTLTTAADIWSLAATILHVFAGAAPFSGVSVIRIIASLNERKKPSIPSTLPAGLHWVLYTCFQCRPADRPDIAEALRRLQVKHNFATA